MWPQKYTTEHHIVKEKTNHATLETISATPLPMMLRIDNFILKDLVKCPTEKQMVFPNKNVSVSTCTISFFFDENVSMCYHSITTLCIYHFITTTLAHYGS